MSGKIRFMCVLALLAAGSAFAVSGVSSKSGTDKTKEKPGLTASPSNNSVSRSDKGTTQDPAQTQKPDSKPTAAPSAGNDKPGSSSPSDHKSVVRAENGTPQQPSRGQEPQVPPVLQPMPVPVPFIQSYREHPGSNGGGGGGYDPGRNGYGGGGYGGGGNHRRGGGQGRGGNGGGQHWHGWNSNYAWHGVHDQWRHQHYRDHGSWLFLWFHGPEIYFAPSYGAGVIRIPHDRVGVYVRQTGDDRLGAQFADAVREELSSQGTRVVYSESDASLELYLVSMDENPEDPGYGSAVSVSYVWFPGNRFVTAQMVDVGSEQVYDLAGSVAGYANQLVDQYR